MRFTLSSPNRDVREGEVREGEGAPADAVGDAADGPAAVMLVMENLLGWAGRYVDTVHPGDNPAQSERAVLESGQWQRT